MALEAAAVAGAALLKGILGYQKAKQRRDHQRYMNELAAEMQGLRLQEEADRQREFIARQDAFAQEAYPQFEKHLGDSGAAGFERSRAGAESMLGNIYANAVAAPDYGGAGVTLPANVLTAEEDAQNRVFEVGERDAGNRARLESYLQGFGDDSITARDYNLGLSDIVRLARDDAGFANLEERLANRVANVREGAYLGHAVPPDGNPILEAAASALGNWGASQGGYGDLANLASTYVVEPINRNVIQPITNAAQSGLSSAYQSLFPQGGLPRSSIPPLSRNYKPGGR